MRSSPSGRYQLEVGAISKSASVSCKPGLHPRRELLDDTLLVMAVAGSTRIEISSHSSDLGHWRAAGRPAEPRLRDSVIGYFASEGYLPRPLQERHLPSREVAIVLNFAAPHRATHRTQPAQPSTETHGSSQCSIAIISMRPSGPGTLW